MLEPTSHWTERVCGVYAQPDVFERDRHCDPCVQSSTCPATHCHLAARNDSSGASTGLTSHPKKVAQDAQGYREPGLSLLGL